VLEVAGWLGAGGGLTEIDRSQAYFNSRDIPCRLVASCDHASVSERLLFMIPVAHFPPPFKTTMAFTGDFALWATKEKDR